MLVCIASALFYVDACMYCVCFVFCTCLYVSLYVLRLLCFLYMLVCKFVCMLGWGAGSFAGRVTLSSYKIKLLQYVNHCRFLKIILNYLQKTM